jgi:predicted Zn finger-like uncharacterized protein
MKFVCEHCQAKYNIADSKLRNKVLKIRCRSCNNIIEVRDPDLVQGSRTSRPPPKAAKTKPAKRAKQSGSVLEERFAESFKSGAAEPAQGTPGLYDAVKRSAETLGRDEAELTVWFVAIAGAPAGPLPAKSIHRHQKAKRVDDDSLVWKEGMPDWTALRNCKELVGLLARIDIEESLSGATDEAAAEPKRGLFAEAPKSRDAAPLKGRSVGMVSQRIDAPAKPEPTSAPAVLDEALGGVEFKAQPAAEPQEVESDFFSTDFSAGMESNLANIQSISPPQVTGAERWVKFAAVGFFGLAIVVLGVVIFLTGGAGEQEVVEKVVEKVVKEVVEVEKEKIVYRDRPVVPLGETGDLSGHKGGGGKKGGKGKGGGKDLDAEKKKLLEQMGLSSPSGDHKLVGGGGGTKGSSGTGSGGSTALSKQQLTSVVNKNRGSLTLCYERSLKQGEAPEDSDVKVMLRMTVGASGMVKSVSVGGGGAKYGGLRSCIQRSVKKWVFPASSGNSSVEYPFLFTPK